MTYYNIHTECETITEAWEYWFNEFEKGFQVSGETADSRDGEVMGECIGAVTVIRDPTRNICKRAGKQMPMRYATGEFLWYLSASNKLKYIQQYSSSWDRMSDDGETLNSAYGYRIMKKFGFNQLEYVARELNRNPNSRQAVIHIKDPVDHHVYPSKDVCCTMDLQYLIRDGKLHAITHMRSNDLWTGFPYDVFCFTCFQIYLAMSLGLEIGTYTHIAGSLHMYKRDYDKIRSDSSWQTSDSST